MSMLALFPWLRIENEIDVDAIKLIPFERKEAKEDSFYSTCQRILKPYVCGNDRPIEKSTLLFLKDKKAFEDFSEEEREYIFSVVEMISFSALSKREFFGLGAWKYCNHSDFMFVIQSFRPESTGVVVVTRRKDGTTTKYITGDVYKVKVPDNVNYNNRVTLDIPLINALLRAQDQLGDEWLLYADAIFSFNRANTDDYQVPQYQEAVMIASAIQCLLKAGHKEDELINKFLSALKPQKDFDVKTSNRVKGSKYERKDKTLREIWLRDFYQMRNECAHGKRKSRIPYLWQMHEHLFLSAYIFPIILKLKLQQDGFYKLTEDDIFERDIFETLADAELFKKPNDQRNSMDWEWNRIRSNVKMKKVTEHIVDKFFAEHYLMEGEYCLFDYSEFPELENRVKDLVQYFDEKYPNILKLVGLSFSGDKVNIIMKDDKDLHAAKYGDNNIKFNPSIITPDDRGFLIHEGTHVAQNFKTYTPWAIEGMADYVRLNLGWDGVIGYNFESNMINFSGDLNQQSYAVWADFFSWLAKKYSKSNFLADFTYALKQDKSDDSFLLKVFSKTASELWNEYLSQVQQNA